MKRKCKPQSEKRSPAERILAALDTAGGWRSGEELADMLGVSRAAVAKHIAALREFGHIIQSRTHKGYLLQLKADRIDRGLVEKCLETAVLGRQAWRILDEAESTNTEAITWALNGCPTGSVVTAERQNGGKGRRGHAWFTSPRSLSVSLVLRPEGGGDGAAATHAALAAMREAIARSTGLETTIKKPNDLYLGGKKICGILVESGLRGDEPDWVVLGAGCNVNVLPSEFPDDIRDRVTSLYAEGAVSVSRNELLARFLNALEPLLPL